jgi:hypothetical protein
MVAKRQKHLKICIFRIIAWIKHLKICIFVLLPGLNNKKLRAHGCKKT